MKTLTNQWIVVMAVWSLLMLLPPSPSMACDEIASCETKLGKIEFGGETHCYTFWGEAGHGVVIEMVRVSGALTPKVQLYNPNGVVVAASEASEIDTPRARIEDYQLTMSGIYTIVASDGSWNVGTGEYGLSLVIAPGDPDWYVVSGQTISSAIKWSGPRPAVIHGYHFWAEAGHGVVIEMARISGALDPMVQLYDPKGVLIAASEASEIDTPRARIENYQLTMSGIYTIVASDGSWNVDTGEYGLSLMIAPGDAASLCECIVSSETKLGNIEFAGKMHCYPFCGEVGHGVVIEMARISGALDPTVQLYDPKGVQVAASEASEIDTPRARIENYQLTMSGIYTIVASDGSWNVDTGEYGLSLVITGGTTTVGDDRDGSDMIAGRAQSGAITPSGDLDTYVFYGQIGQGVAIDMSRLSTSSEPLDPRLQLYDPRGVQVAASEASEIDTPRVRIENHQLTMSGIYTIVASDGSWNVDTGEYGLSVSVMPPKEPRGLYPYGPQPADGQLIDYCDPNTAFSDVLVENLVLPGGSVVTRHSSAYLLSWWSVLGATGYDVYFSGGPCLPLETIAENVADPWVPMPEIVDEQVCSWRVVAHTPAGHIQGPTWWFIARCVPPPPDICTLTVDVVGQGSIEGAAEGINEYPCGAEVLIKAKPDPGYEFVRWEGSAADGMEDPTAPEITLIVDDDEALIAVFEDLVHEVTMDVDPDWTLEGQWEYGTPTGQRCSEWGNVDPTSGCTGPNVLGVNLDGCYDLAIGGPYYATTDAFDLSGYEDVRLRFCRWLNCDIPEYVRCTVEVSTDGEHWTLLWTQAEREEITDTEWTVCEYPLTQADSQPTVYLRWGYHVLRERAYAYTGWNLDDVQLIGRRP